MATIGTTALTILKFVIAFGALIFLHEFGHFIFARISKIDVEEFGFGYPPRLVKLFRAGGTDFTLNWIPFGGFTRMKGENGDVTEAGSFMAARPSRRLITLLGGPTINLLTGLLLLAYLFTRLGSPDTTRVQIADVTAGSPAAVSGIQMGDIITSIDGVKIDSIQTLSSEINAHLGEPLSITLIRNGQEIQLTSTPRKEWPANQGPLGITITNPTRPVNILQALPQAGLATLDQGYQMVVLPVRLIRGQVAPADARIVSVKGIYDIYAQVQTVDQQEAAQGSPLAGLNTLYFFAVISIALGYTNLLPIPALDGGRIVFLLPELLFKKKVPPAIEGRIHMVFYAILLTLMVVLVINDIVNPVVLPK